MIEPKVSIIPSAWYFIVSGTFLTAESFGISWFILKIRTHFYFFQNHLTYLILKEAVYVLKEFYMDLWYTRKRSFTYEGEKNGFTKF